MSELKGKVVVVVGASKGIGLAASEAAASEGATVYMASRARNALDEAVRAVKGSAKALPVDMLDRGAVELALASVNDGGPIDHLVLSAVGDEYALFGPVAKLSDAQVTQSFEKLRGFVNIVRAAAPRLGAGATVTMISGAGAARPPKETALAAASNASIVAFAKAMAVDLAPVRVNVVMPGVVDTDRHGAKRESLRAWAENELPARRFGTPEDIADAIMFVMKNPYMTGHTLVIDGGFLGQ
jgi:NAD(P)-dependent dehydrogenase (short-subunit alcohol dehydrogenase family)